MTLSKKKTRRKDKGIFINVFFHVDDHVINFFLDCVPFPSFQDAIIFRTLSEGILTCFHVYIFAPLYKVSEVLLQLFNLLSRPLQPNIWMTKDTYTCILLSLRDIAHVPEIIVRGGEQHFLFHSSNVRHQVVGRVNLPKKKNVF